MKSQRIELILIGVGPHARRIYLPLIKKKAQEGLIKLVAVVDLESQEENVTQTLRSLELSDVEFISASTGVGLSPEHCQKMYSKFSDNYLKAAIISSEPLSHAEYAFWAMDNDISVLIDKPITTYENVSTDPARASQFLVDYDALLDKYRRSKKKHKSTTFAVMAQRRYHTSYNLIKAAIAEVFELTNCPVTAVNTFHSDGQWRTPTEMMTQLYHSYFQGYGKGSHSGYHYFDIVPYILSAAVSHHKNYDQIETVSAFVRPDDFVAQLGIADQSRILNSVDFDVRHKMSDEEFIAQMGKFGEMDLNSQILFKNNGRTITHWNLSLCHNGVSQRDWGHPQHRCLYKGIGRVAHESHVFEQGPFQSVQFHSYKSKDNPIGNDCYGGERHLEIVIYRNNRLINGEHVQKFNLKDLNELEEKPNVITSPAKEFCFEDFISTLSGKLKISRCDLELQKPSVQVTQSIYESGALRFKGENPIVRRRFDLQPTPITNMSLRQKVQAKLIEKYPNIVAKKLGL